MALLYRKQGHTGILTLSRPEARNCWGQDYNDGLLRHLDEANDDDEVRSVILTDEQYALLPSVTSPDFLLDWTEEDEDADGNPLPWPTYTVQGKDMNGNTISWQQAAGAFA